MVLVLCVATSCAETQSGTIAGRGPAAGGKLVIADVTAKYGSAEVTLPSGERCAGEFNTVADHVTWDDDRLHWVDSEDSRLGMLVVSCPSGYVLRCDFSQVSEGPGHGACRDPSGARYTLAL